ncbi:MAG: RNA polymerase sigma factor [Anaeroplasmataceae bacterium]|nr:RNA polymerase sigma factor [Anaeroplasmataceae bacterium]
MQEDLSKIKDLIRRISKDDEKALEELFQITKQKLYYVAKKFLIEKSYIEDVLSESYLKIYKRSRGYNERYDGYTWMYTIVKNTAIDYNRKIGRQGTIVEYDDSIYNPNEEFISKIKREDIQQALKELDEQESEIIYLRIWENRTLKVIAKKLDYNITGVYRKYNEALEKLRKVLE